MKLFKTHRKLAVSGLALTVALLGGGVAFAYFSAPGSGTGSAQVGSNAKLLIDQLGGTPVYNSTVDASTYQWSYSFQGGTGANALGNKINLSNGGGALSDVVVAMTNFNNTSGSLPLTLNIYNPGSYDGPGTGPGSLIATDTTTVSFPATATGYDANNPPTYGLANFNATFNFSSQNITLPGTVVYEILFPNPQPPVASGVNVQLSNEASQVSVGSDADPGYLFVSTYNNQNDATGGANGEITCDNVGSTFGEYPTAVGATGCGETTTNSAPYPSIALIPAVEFDTSGMGDLYPGGAAQPINFSITNPGTTPAAVTSVTVAVATDPANSLVESVPGESWTDQA